MRIALISGTAREGRQSHHVALALQQALENKDHEVDLIDVAKLDLQIFKCLYANMDSKPQLLKDAKEKLDASDALIFVTPEYNGSISSSLKNFIDLFAKAPFSGKPIGVATASAGAKAGIRAAYMLQQIILSIFAYPQPTMLMVPEVQDKFDEKGKLIDESFEKDFNRFLDAYLEWAPKLL